jgi:hypothetical protein
MHYSIEYNNIKRREEAGGRRKNQTELSKKRT